ncbi:excinuclease ABC subunit UvrC [Rhodoblastus acidophilus]|uniref:UvrABC system protein C n=1 Tax=Rhodoblastus acidophilus TaxID=1074 RepID=A0A6N8DHI3_RHOAC|nr:excinuclease ABC subunit UvrC [Rhodoblastus acidophilus]MCW2272677.1 excinuclease ABC subunit C [Rhodoblastus acidophilus]MTV29588.1 excinuclease ABC subunit UvrC [Rhodoblastus acidophilus]
MIPDPENDLPDTPNLDDEDDAELAPEAAVELDFDACESPDALKRGVRAIRDHWKHAPSGPGVYRMLAEDGAVLYVGKAKSIKKRIASYMRVSGHTNRIARMIALTTTMVFASTETEVEALLLEANLIKQLKPRFNVLLRDDKSFPYILLTKDERGAQIVKHRGARGRKGDYFGPFAGVWAVNNTLNTLQKAFLLRTCENSFFDNRTRPCLLFQIKRCSGPCTAEISPADYDELVREARDFLCGKSRAVRERLAAEMNAAAEELEFERAGRLRDRIAALAAIQAQQGINPRNTPEADVFGLHEEAGQFCVEAVFIRAGQNWGNRAYFPRADKVLTPGEVLGPFLGQFYADRPAPRCVLLSHEIEEADLLAEALSARAGHKVEVFVPKRGEKAELVGHAQRNAREALGRKIADTAGQQRLLDALGAAFGMEKTPRRVEIYDNSHIMGSAAIGAMVVAGPQGFVKNQYRTFNIKSDIAPGDDYAMMREVLGRRFTRILKEGEPDSSDPEAFPQKPDLILIDGGRGQFSATLQVMRELGVEGITLASIAKGVDRDAGRETFFVEGREPFRLPPRDPALYFVQRLRDEAHRFAIGTHRAKRKKEFVKNPLDEIAGIGPARKRALLQAFGTAKAVAGAALADLEKTPGLSAATAKLVYDHFHEKG